MWKSILETILGSIWTAVRGWFEAEQAESAKWAAEARKQQLDSIKEGLAIEAEWRNRVDAAGKKPQTIADWNTLARTASATALLLSLSGCFRFYVVARPYQPVPPKIERPTIPTDPPELTDREHVLMRYALQLEAGYQAVREQAIKHNEEAGLPTPVE